MLKEVPPSLWVVYYQDVASPTQSVTYHFVGGGDDILMIRFNGRLVLARNRDNPPLDVVKTFWHPQANHDYHYPPGNLTIPNGFAKDGVTYDPGPGGPLFPGFKLSRAALSPAKEGTVYPPHSDKDGPLWRAVSSPDNLPFQ